MNKRLVLFGICVAAICLIFFLSISYKKELNLKWNEVQQINISGFPPRFNPFDIVEEEHIHEVVDYLGSLHTINTRKNPREYLGGGYSIKIYLKNGNTRDLWLSGNMFFIEKDRFIYEVPYKEAIKFDTIVANILEDYESKTNESSITGEVVSISSEASGRNISCVIEGENNINYNINLEHANLIDATGKGSMILHRGDKIKVFYQKDEQIDNDSINALTVYIKSTA